MHRKFGKKDVIFIGALLGICLIVLGVWYFAGGKQGALVVVTREGEVYGTDRNLFPVTAADCKN